MIRFLKSKLFLLAEMVILTFSIIAFVKTVNKKSSIDSEIGLLQSQAQKLKEEKQFYQQELQETSLSSYVELEAKKKLNYRRPGETVLVFYEDTARQPLPAKSALSQKETKEPSNLVKWWEYFFRNGN
jgi:cell division protein FtsB